MELAKKVVSFRKVGNLAEFELEDGSKVTGCFDGDPFSPYPRISISCFASDSRDTCIITERGKIQLFFYSENEYEKFRNL